MLVSTLSLFGLWPAYSLQEALHRCVRDDFIHFPKTERFLRFRLYDSTEFLKGDFPALTFQHHLTSLVKDEFYLVTGL